jgi:hypothetical protein
MPIIDPEPPHGSLGEFRAGKKRAEVLLPNVERPTNQPRKTVSQINPELPHGSLGEFRALKQKSYLQRAAVMPPEVGQPPREKR